MTLLRDNFKSVGFEVLTAGLMKSTIFWDITPCSSLKVNRRFGRTYRLHLYGRKISRARNQRETEEKWRNGTPFPSCFLYNPKFRLTDCSAFMLVSWSAYFSSLKMEAICVTETSVDFQPTTQRYIPEDDTLQF
jgi:hypothetical protein